MIETEYKLLMIKVWWFATSIVLTTSIFMPFGTYEGYVVNEVLLMVGCAMLLIAVHMVPSREAIQ